jgi:signal transduction histidine kinase
VQAVGVDPQRQPVAERGPREVRDAARAVNAMQARLRALIADRTRTLAAVAHDFRTPLMRLRLGLERLAAPQRDALSKEIDELEALVSSFIAFAREDPAEESRVRLDIAALVDSQVQDRAAEGAAVRYQGLQRLVVMGQRLALKRLVANLLDNALKYGAHAVLRLSAQGGFAVIEFEDDGPGVPAAERERIFEPFVRLNHTGSAGAGLGLAAARSIARAHGGDVVALAAPGGGGLFRVTLPLSV